MLRRSIFSIPETALSLRSFYFPGCLLIGPLLLIPFPELPFLNNGHCDPWYVFGLFHNLPEMVTWWPRGRQPGRFAEILPGFVFTRLLPGAYADYAQFLVFFTLSVGLIFKTVEVLFSTRRAALSAIFFSFSPFMIGTYGVTYDGPVISYEIISLFGVARALTTSNPRYRLGWMLLSGLGWGAAVNAHLASLLFGACGYLFFALRVAFEQRLSLRSRIVVVSAAAVVVLAGLILSHILLGALAALVFKSSPLIVLNQVYEAAGVFAGDSKGYWIAHWYFHGANAGMYLLGLAVACIYLVSHFRRARNKQVSTASERHTLAIALSFILSFGVWFADDMLGATFLQYETYFVFMWPFLTLTIFAGDLGWDAPSRFPFVLIFLVACCLGATVKVTRFAHISGTMEAAISAFIALVIALFAGLSLKIQNKSGRTALAVGFLLLLSLTSLFARPHKMGYQLWADPENAKVLRHAYARLHAGINFIDRITKDASDMPSFWADPDEVGDATGYARSFLACEFAYFPAVGDDISNSKTGDFIVVIARPANLLDRIKAAVSGLKLDLRVVDAMVLNDEQGAYSIVITVVNKQK